LVKACGRPVKAIAVDAVSKNQGSGVYVGNAGFSSLGGFSLGGGLGTGSSYVGGPVGGEGSVGSGVVGVIKVPPMPEYVPTAEERLEEELNPEKKPDQIPLPPAEEGQRWELRENYTLRMSEIRDDAFKGISFSPELKTEDGRSLKLMPGRRVYITVERGENAPDCEVRVVWIGEDGKEVGNAELGSQQWSELKGTVRKLEINRVARQGAVRFRVDIRPKDGKELKKGDVKVGAKTDVQESVPADKKEEKKEQKKQGGEEGAMLLVPAEAGGALVAHLDVAVPEVVDDVFVGFDGGAALQQIPWAEAMLMSLGAVLSAEELTSRRTQKKQDGTPRLQFNWAANTRAAAVWLALFGFALLGAWGLDGQWMAKALVVFFGFGAAVYGLRSAGGISKLYMMLLGSLSRRLGVELKENRDLKESITKQFAGLNRYVNFSELKGSEFAYTEPNGIDARGRKTYGSVVFASWLVRDVQWQGQGIRTPILLFLQVINRILRLMILPHVLAQEELRVAQFDRLEERAREGRAEAGTLSEFFRGVYTNPLISLAHALPHLISMAFDLVTGGMLSERNSSNSVRRSMTARLLSWDSWDKELEVRAVPAALVSVLPSESVPYVQVGPAVAGDQAALISAQISYTNNNGQAVTVQMGNESSASPTLLASLNQARNADASLRRTPGGDVKAIDLTQSGLLLNGGIEIDLNAGSTSGRPVEQRVIVVRDVDGTVDGQGQLRVEESAWTGDYDPVVLSNLAVDTVFVELEVRPDSQSSSASARDFQYIKVPQSEIGGFTSGGGGGGSIGGTSRRRRRDDRRKG
jgi:hypothetical protein